MASYCTVEEVGTLGINAEAIADVDPTAITTEIQVTSDMMDSYFADRFTLPLTMWGLVVRKCCAVLTGASLLRTRGYNPESDPSVKDAITYWTDWLAQVAAGEVRPTVIDGSTTPVVDGFRGGQVVTRPSRGLDGYCDQACLRGPLYRW